MGAAATAYNIAKRAVQVPEHVDAKHGIGGDNAEVFPNRSPRKSCAVVRWFRRMVTVSFSLGCRVETIADAAVVYG